MIEKKLPGVAPVYMLYDARDRLALSQDGNQRAGNEWLYTLYDTFNRVVESGTCVIDTPVDSLRATVGTSCNYIPGTRTALLENFYDHYGPEALPFEAARDISGHADGDGNPNGYHDLVASMITTTRERVLDDDGSNWVTTTCYYDNELRIIQVKRQYPSNRVTVTGNKYDFAGNVSRAKEWQTLDGTTVSMEQEFTRDARGRSLSTRQRVNDGEWVTINELEYDGLGRLAAKRLHGGIDSIAYAYNARGWTTGIHGKNFKETLHYTDPPAALGVPARYNGNIAATMWQHGTGERQAYGYDYDGLDRLANAHHGRGTTTITRTNEYSVTGITHDKNGNILTLSRRANGNTVDDLAYRYSGNRLMNVHDASGHAAGYDNTGALTADRYLYDANGNMTRDLNNGITAVSYNFLNLPRQVTRGGQTMKYVYTATGTKLRNSLPGKTLDYIGSFVYEDGALSYILTGEGRYVVNGSTGTHEYNLADHLGNVRAVIDQEGNVIQATSYYPFGMPFTRAGSSDNKYLYNGKEEQEETGWLDYGWRMYDASVGRWFCTDLLSELNPSVSAYAYVSNNPVRYIDIMGLSQEDPPIDKGVLPEVTVKGYRNQTNPFWGFYSPAYGSSWQEYLEQENQRKRQQALIELNQWERNKDFYSPNVQISWKAGIGMTFDGIGGFGKGMQKTGGTFRLTSGKSTNQFSVKHYGSGWRGGSRAGITTYSMVKTGKILGRVSLVGNLVLGIYNIREAAKLDEGYFGRHAIIETAGTAGGFAGAWVGIQAGAYVGSPAGPLGVAIGGLIGGVVGGFYGADVVENITKKVYDFF